MIKKLIVISLILLSVPVIAFTPEDNLRFENIRLKAQLRELQGLILQLQNQLANQEAIEFQNKMGCKLDFTKNTPVCLEEGK